MCVFLVSLMNLMMKFDCFDSEQNSPGVTCEGLFGTQFQIYVYTWMSRINETLVLVLSLDDERQCGPNCTPLSAALCHLKRSSYSFQGCGQLMWA